MMVVVVVVVVVMVVMRPTNDQLRRSVRLRPTPRR
jgi:hypothetical protein